MLVLAQSAGLDAEEIPVRNTVVDHKDWKADRVPSHFQSMAEQSFALEQSIKSINALSCLTLNLSLKDTCVVCLIS